MRRLLVSTALAASAAAASVGVGAAAQDDLTVEGNVALVTDYRFRGVSLSDKDPAIQGGFDVTHTSGFYIGTWASSIEPYGNAEIELDAYVGYGIETGPAKFDLGLLSYNFPGATGNADYYEVYGSIGAALGPLETSIGANYAWEQSNVGNGDEDNVYVYLTGALPIGESPFAISSTVGWEDGALDFSPNDSKVNWDVGVSTSVLGVDLGLSYVGTDLSDGEAANLAGSSMGDEGFVFSIAKSL